MRFRQILVASVLVAALGLTGCSAAASTATTETPVPSASKTSTATAAPDPTAQLPELPGVTPGTPEGWQQVSIGQLAFATPVGFTFDQSTAGDGAGGKVDYYSDKSNPGQAGSVPAQLNAALHAKAQIWPLAQQGFTAYRLTIPGARQAALVFGSQKIEASETAVSQVYVLSEAGTYYTLTLTLPAALQTARQLVGSISVQ